MIINEITQTLGRSRTRRKRIGRGIGSHGKTSGRGHKGESSRSGAKAYLIKDGGQMPFFRKVAKRGFNARRILGPESIAVVNISDIESLRGSVSTIDINTLKDYGLSLKSAVALRMIGSGLLSKPYNIHANHVSRTATRAILGAGGSITLV